MDCFSDCCFKNLDDLSFDYTRCICLPKLGFLTFRPGPTKGIIFLNNDNVNSDDNKKNEFIV